MRRRISTLIALLAAAACSPALDWREVHPERSDAVALFPCRPASDSRRVHIGSQPAEMFIVVCSASGRTFALGYADVGDPARVPMALEALRASAVDNVGGRASATTGLNVPGMTPQPGTSRWRISGQLPDGKAVQVEAAFFARGTRVYQASVVAPSRPTDDDAVDTFFGGLRLGA